MNEQQKTEQTKAKARQIIEGKNQQIAALKETAKAAGAEAKNSAAQKVDQVVKAEGQKSMAAQAKLKEAMNAKDQ